MGGGQISIDCLGGPGRNIVLSGCRCCHGKPNIPLLAGATHNRKQRRLRRVMQLELTAECTRLVTETGNELYRRVADRHISSRWRRVERSDDGRIVDRGHSQAIRSAPGVQVWTAASVKGASSKTGTSFAAPFVTAAVAMIKAANPQLKADEVKTLLRQGAEDLGKPGKDPVFGWGLLNARTICQS